MNKRIQLLAHRCGFTEYRGDDGADDESLTKFAQLIVQECVIQCEREWIRHGADSAHNQAIHGCINSIKQHFGVEE